MLLNLKPGLIVHANTISEVREVFRDDLSCTEVRYADRRREVISRRFDDIKASVWPIVPAPPGYIVIQAFPPEKDGEETTFATYPVIAFRITDREPLPITPLGKLDDHWALVWPDGRCDEQWNRLFPSVQAYKNSFGPKGVRS